MTKRIGNTLIIEEEPPDRCSECKSYEELRPYAPDDKLVCFPCFQKHPEWARYAEQKMFGGPA